MDDARAIGTHNDTDLGKLVAVAREVVNEAEQAGVMARLIGGVAVVLHSTDDLAPALRRKPEDIDVVVHKSGKAKLDGLFGRASFAPDRRFNALNGADRRIYHSQGGVKVDVFVGAFRMCHIIPMDEKRLALDRPTAPLAELLLTKAQVVRLTRKDIIDLIALISDHDVGDHDDGVINMAWIAELCGRDWGLWRTVSDTLRQLMALTDDFELDGHTRTRVGDRVRRMLSALDGAPKSQKWKMRSRIGERMAWYELPEDPSRAAEAGGAT